LPVGLVSDRVDDRFRVSADLLVKNPAEARARVARYLKAMRTNIDYLKARKAELEEFSRVSSAAGQAYRRLADDISKKLVPWAAGTPFGRELAELYLGLDALSAAYNGLSADVSAKAKEVGRAVEVEQKRHDRLKSSIKTLFGFD